MCDMAENMLVRMHSLYSSKHFLYELRVSRLLVMLKFGVGASN